MFTLTVFEILRLEGRSVLGPAQRGTGNERVRCQSLLFYLELNMWFYLNFKMSTLTSQLNQYYQRPQFSETMDSRL